MTADEMLEKVVRVLEDARDGVLTPDEAVDHLACMFDGDAAYALAGHPPLPKVRLVLTVTPR